MSFAVSQGSITSTSRPNVPSVSGGHLTTFRGLTQAYQDIYRSQPNVRTVVGFIGKNVGQLSLDVLEDKADGELDVLRDHGLAKLIRKPNLRTSRPRFIRSIAEDLGIFDNFIALKVQLPSGQRQLLRIPPQVVEPIGDNWLFPDGYRILGTHNRPEYGWEQVLHIAGYNPTDPRWGLSPIETLRSILAEDIAAAEYREQLWARGARMSGVIQRPENAPDWSPSARERFKRDFRSRWVLDGEDAGGTPVLEEGMTFKEVTFSARESEYLGARKLAREEVAAAYHVAAPLVGIMGATGGATEVDGYHKLLYQDTLGPLLEWIAAEVALQLLPDFETDAGRLDRMRTSFNIEEKMAGSFTEQAEALSRATGAPWLRRNEARARVHLPPVEGGDELVTPLNVVTGGRANPTDTAPGTPGAGQVGQLSLALEDLIKELPQGDT